MQGLVPRLYSFQNWKTECPGSDQRLYRLKIPSTCEMPATSRLAVIIKNVSRHCHSWGKCRSSPTPPRTAESRPGSPCQRSKICPEERATSRESILVARQPMLKS